MSTEIDNKIVQMEFRNENFEKNAKQSMSTLDTIEKKLQNGSKFTLFDAIQTASEKVSLHGLASAVDGIASKFSNLGIVGVTALQNITNSAINTGKNLIKSMSVDQVTAGWSKYEQKTASVQTLINSTGQTIDQINAQLDDLMWFSDETSYGFTDMTSALATMTSSGGDIKKLVPMIMGIANSVAYAGKGAQEFSRVMYNLNQSYSSGALTLMDWKSVELAGASSKQLKEELIKAAEAQGKIEKGMITIDNFNTTLKDKWADREVMEQAFGVFAQRTMEARQMVKDGIVETGSEAYAILGEKYDDVGMRAANAAQEAKTFVEAIEATKDAVSSGFMQSFEYIFGNYEEAKVLWTDLADGLWEIFASGSVARNEMLKAWHDADQLGEGGRTDALWAIYRVIEAIGSVLAPVKEGFREIFPKITIDQLKNATKTFASLVSNIKISDKTIQNIKDSSKGLFSVLSIAVQFLKPILKMVANFAMYVLPSLGKAVMSITGFIGRLLSALDQLQKETGFFQKAFDIVEHFLSYAVIGIKTLYESISKLFDSFGSINIGDLKKIITTLQDIFGKGFGAVFKVLDSFSNGVTETINTIFGKLTNFGNLDTSIFSKWAEDIQKNLGPIFDKISEWADSASDGVNKAFKDIQNVIKDFGKTDTSGVKRVTSEITNEFKPLEKIGDFFKKIFDKIKEIFDNIPSEIKEKVGQFGNEIKNIFSAIVDAFKTMNFDRVVALLNTGLLGVIIGKLISFTKAFKDSFGKINNISSAVVGILDSVKGCFEAWQNSIKSNIILKIAIAVALLAVSLTQLAEIPQQQLVDSLTAIVILLGSLMTAMKSLVPMMQSDGAGIFAGFDKKKKKFSLNAKGLRSAGTEVLKFATSILILAKAVEMISDLDPDKLWIGVGAISALMTVMTALSIVLNRARVAVSGLGANINNTINNNVTINPIASFAVAIIAMASAITMLMIPVKTLSSMNIEELVKGLGGLLIMVGAMIAAMIVATKKMDPLDLYGLGSQLIALSFALTLLTIPIEAMAHLDWAEWARAMIGIPGIIALLGLAIRVFPNAKQCVGVAKAMIALSGAFAVFSVSMLIMTPALMALSLLTNEKMLAGLAAVALVFVGLGIAAKKLAAQAKAMIFIAGAFALLAVGVSVLATFASKIVEAGDDIGEAMLVMIKSAAYAIKNSVYFIVDAVLGLIIAALEALHKNIPVIVEELCTMIITILQEVDRYVPEMVTVALKVLQNLFDAVVKTFKSGEADPASIAVVLLTMGALVGLFKMIGSLKTDTKQVIKTVGLMVLAIGAIGGVIGAISYFLVGENWQSALSVCGGVTLVIAALALVFPFISEAGKKGINALAGIGLITLALVGIGAVLTLLMWWITAAGIDMSKTLTLVAGIGILAISLSASLILVGALGATAPLALAGVGVLTLALVGIGAVLTLLMWWITAAGIDISQIVTFATGIAIVVFALTPALVGLGALGVLCVGAIVGAVALVAVVAILGAAMVGLGYLFQQVEEIKPLLESGIEVLGLIGQGIGSFIGGIVYGFSEQVLKVLPALGEALSGFMAGASPFIEGAKNIDQNFLDGVLRLAAAIIAITAAELINSVASLITGGDPLSQFVEKLPTLGEGLMAFADSVSGLKNTSSLDAAINSAKMLGEFMKALPKEGGLLQALTGTVDLEKFSEQLPGLGTNLKKFSTSSEGLNKKSVEIAVNAAKMIGEFIDNFKGIRTGGVAGFFNGDIDIQHFSAHLPNLGISLKQFSTNADGLNSKSVEAAVSAAKMIAGWADNFDGLRTGGVAGFFNGDIDIQHFSAHLPNLGISLKQFSDYADGISSQSVTTATYAAELLATVAEMLPKEGGLFDGWTAHSQDLGTFGESIWTLGEWLLGFSNYTLGMDMDKMLTAIEIVKAFAELAKNLAEDGFSKLVDFTKLLSEVGDFGISNFINNLTNSKADIDAAIAEFIKQICDAIEANKEGLKTKTSELKEVVLSAIRSDQNEFGDVSEHALSEYVRSFENFSKSADDSYDKSAIKRCGEQAVNWIKEGLKEAYEAESYTQAVKALIDYSIEILQSSENTLKIKSAGAYLVDGFVNGIDIASPNVKRAARKMANLAYEEVCKTLDEHSPSKKMEEPGYNTGAGFANGIDKSAPRVRDSARGMARTARDAVQNEVNSGKRGLQLFDDIDLGFGKSDLSGLTDYEKWKEQIYTPDYGELQAATESGADTGEAWAGGFESSVTNTVVETTSSALDAIANAVIRGDWGNGEERMNKLIGAGYDYHEVQNRVNELLGIIKSSVDSASNELDITPTITPVVDTSLMSEGLTGANDYLLTSTGEMSPTYEITSETTSKQLATDIINNDTTNYTEIINEMEKLRQDLANFAEQAANSQMVLDTGTLVGEITPKIDAQLAQRASYAGRGN